jgi:hypothetical protein
VNNYEQPVPEAELDELEAVPDTEVESMEQCQENRQTLPLRSKGQSNAFARQ